MQVHVYRQSSFLHLSFACNLPHQVSTIMDWRETKLSSLIDIMWPRLPQQRDGRGWLQSDRLPRWCVP